MADPDPRPLIVLLGTLEPSDPLGSTITFLEWAHRTGAMPRPSVVALRPGAWAQRVATVADLHVVHDPKGWSPSRAVQRARLQRPAQALRSVELRRRLRRPHRALYVAEPGGTPLLRWAPTDATPVVAHLHEVGPGLGALSDDERALLVGRARRWVVGSTARVDALTDMGVEPSSVTTLPDLLGDLNPDEVGDDVVPATRRSLEARLGLPRDAPLVCGAGAVDWWEVPDAFVQLAWELLRRPGRESTHLLWVADGASDRMLWPLRHDIRHAGLEGRVHVLAEGPSVLACIAAGDVFVAARLGDDRGAGTPAAVRVHRPVVWFRAEGEADRLGPDQGIGVPYLDVEAMADAVAALLSDPALRTRHSAGQQGDDRWSPALGGPALLDVLS